jgi:hypothetical protein
MGQLKCVRPHYSSGPDPVNWFLIFEIFSNKQNCSNLKNTKSILLELKFFANNARPMINSKGITFLLERSSNSKWILKYKSRKQIQFEIGLNFKGVQTFEEKFHKFTKNLY